MPCPASQPCGLQVGRPHDPTGFPIWAACPASHSFSGRLRITVVIVSSPPDSPQVSALRVDQEFGTRLELGWGSIVQSQPTTKSSSQAKSRELNKCPQEPTCNTALQP